MKKRGKIVDYNNCSGYIMDDNGVKYILLYQNILYEDAKVGDIVSFTVEKFETVEVNELIATFVRKEDF